MTRRSFLADRKEMPKTKQLVDLVGSGMMRDVLGNVVRIDFLQSTFRHGSWRRSGSGRSIQDYGINDEFITRVLVKSQEGTSASS
jgi:uncharacterized membrane protein